MHTEAAKAVIYTTQTIQSVFLDREVTVDSYLPVNISHPERLPLLLVNDGQDLPRFNFADMLDEMITFGVIEPIIVIGIYCGDDRKNEYGTAFISDYKGRGAKAGLYTSFIFEELLPFIRKEHGLPHVREKAFAGFSLGALSAMDIVWNRPEEFEKMGLFSGSFWWRTKGSHDEEFSEDLDRIMHQQIRAGNYAPWLKFFFQCGSMDEVEDRNGNGVIDSIDDTRDLIDELVTKGYKLPENIFYYEMPDGRHDVPTWGKAMPEFLRWGWGIPNDLM